MSFNTSNISCDTVIGNLSISAPTHNVGSVVLSESSTGNLNVNALSMNTDLLNAEYVVASESITTPLIVGDIGFPVSVENLKTVTLNNGGSGSDGQILGLDSSLNLVWKDDKNDPQNLYQVLTTGNDASGSSILNLQSLTVSNGPALANQLLSVDSSLNLKWVTADKSIPGIMQVLDSENDASQRSILNLNKTQSKSFELDNVVKWDLEVSSGNLLLSSDSSGVIVPGADLVSNHNIKASVLIGKKPSYDYYVSPNGDDSLAESTNGGTMENPWQSIQACINYVETIYDGSYRYIHIMAGGYNEDITVTKKLYLQGESVTGSSASVGCYISGTVNVNIDTNGSDMFNNGFYISGLLINGYINFVSSENSMLIVENSYIYSPNDTAGRCLYFQPLASNSRCRLWNTQFISGGASGQQPLVELTSVGSLQMNYCNLSAKGLQNCLLFSGSSTCDTVNNCKFECSNTDANVKALVEVTTGISSVYTFSNCGFVYSSSVNKVANNQASGILCNAAFGNPRIVSLYNTFFLLGTQLSNYAIQDLKAGTANAMVCVFFMSNASIGNAFSINALLNTNKYQLQICS
jgi:hypothetical protein